LRFPKAGDSFTSLIGSRSQGLNEGDDASHGLCLVRGEAQSGKIEEIFWSKRAQSALSFWGKRGTGINHYEGKLSVQEESTLQRLRRRGVAVHEQHLEVIIE
jgi:hypothetical protein